MREPTLKDYEDGLARWQRQAERLIEEWVPPGCGAYPKWQSSLAFARHMIADYQRLIGNSEAAAPRQQPATNLH